VAHTSALDISPSKRDPDRAQAKPSTGGSRTVEPNRGSSPTEKGDAYLACSLRRKTKSDRSLTPHAAATAGSRRAAQQCNQTRRERERLPMGSIAKLYDKGGTGDFHIGGYGNECCIYDANDAANI
jgi:hypothetical protein